MFQFSGKMRSILSFKYTYVTDGDALIFQRVTGELYRVNGTVLKFLDELEGHPGYYTRTAIPVEVIKTTFDASKTASYVNHNDANTASEVIQCEVYLLPNFKKDLLKLDYLDCYFENSAKKYVPGNARPIGAPPWKSLVKDIQSQMPYIC